MSFIRKIATAEKNFEGGLESLAGLGDSFLEKSDQTYQERFGDALGVVRDRASEEASANRRAVKRALMVGGDVTGAGLVVANTLNEGANRSIGGTEVQFALENENINTANLDRYGRVISDTVAANADARNFYTNQKNHRDMLKIQQQQAKKQRRAGIIGGALKMGGLIAGGPIGAAVGDWVGKKLGV